jgi:CheY-like chemotaxis protein
LKIMGAIPAAILCIDDEEPALVVRRRLLERAGYRVFTALTGKEGIEIFRYQPFAVVILDYWMADMDGLDVAAELKLLKPKTPIIMLSGYTAILDEGLGKVDLWLRKGEGDPEQLIMAVAQLLGRDRPKQSG